jgi:DNA-directed RNA polymerase specialized sigma24 family protein
MSAAPSITVANGVTVSTEPADPLVARRAEVTRDHLRESIRRLSVAERDALRLATRERRSVDESAVELQVAPEEIHFRLYSGLLSLRRSLLDQLGED